MTYGRFEITFPPESLFIFQGVGNDGSEFAYTNPFSVVGSFGGHNITIFISQIGPGPSALGHFIISMKLY